MSATNDIYSLDYVVKSVMMDLGETSTRHKQQLLNFAIQGYRRLNLAGMLPTTKTILLDIDPNTNTALLPKDYIDYLKVGLCVGCQNGKGMGGFVNLSYNDAICGNFEREGLDTCGCAESFITEANNVNCGNTDGMQAWWFMPYWYGGGWYDGSYGYGAGNYTGGFKVFKEQGIIALDSVYTGEKILLEYMSNGLAGLGTIVPEGAIGVLTAWVHFQRVLHSQDRTTRLSVIPYKQQFNSEFMGFRARNASMTLHDFKQIYYRSMRQTIKR